MKKIIGFVLSFVIVVVTSSCCIANFAEAEESSVVAVEEKNEEIDEEIVYGELPWTPLGLQDHGHDESIPDDIWNAAVIWGMDYNIAPEFICAIAYHETRYQNIKSSNGKWWGVMQIHPQSHRTRMEKLGVTDLMDISQNIHVATDLLAEFFEEYEDPAIVLMKYHGESQKNITRYEKTGKMSGYASSILEYSAELERAHGK